MWKTLYSLTFGNNQSIVLRKKNNTLLHSKPLNQSSRISKSQRTRPHPGFSTRLWCVNIKKVLSLGLYRHSSFCLLCHQMFCEWVKMVAATATPLEAAVCASHSLTLGSVTELSIGFSGNTTTPTMQSLKTRPGRGGKKSQNQIMSQDSYRRSSTTWSARKHFQEDHEYLCKTRHFIVVIEQHLLLQMLQTAAAAASINCAGVTTDTTVGLIKC